MAETETRGADQRSLVRAWTGFALDLYRRLGAGEENLVLSPSSVATVLAMVLPGARGATAGEIAAVLRSDLPPERLAEAAGTLDADLTGRAAEDGLELRISNAVWAQAGLELRPELVDLLRRAFRAGLRAADFLHDPEGARQAIDDLVAEQTAGKIRRLFAPGSLSRDTLLVLTNAIYLQASWLEAFDPADTLPEPFHPLDGGSVEVDMLHREASLHYAEGDGWRAVELPYRGGRLAMDVILPEEDFAAFQRGLDAELLAEALGRLERRQVRLALPKFTFDSSLDLREPLAALGMPTAFTAAADFSGLTEPGQAQLQIDQVVQRAHVEVDERGTTAAAATGASLVLVSVVVQAPVELRVDRPFLFLVRDLPSGQILFLGRVTRP